MKKRIFSLFLVISLMIVSMAPYNSFAASSSSIDKQLADIKRQKAEAEKKAREAQSRIANVKSAKKKTLQEIVELNEQLKATYAKLTELNKRLEETEQELQIKAQELDQAEARVERRDELLKSRLRLIYTNGAVSYLDVLFSATSFSDFLTRLEALKMVFNQDQEILESNKRDRDLVAEKKKEVEATLVMVKGLYDEASALKIELERKEHEKEVQVAQLDKEAEALEKITEEEEKMLMELARKEAKLQAEKNKSLSNLTFPGGTFAFPLPQSYKMTSDFGSRTNPVTGKKGEFHKGLDFGAPNGTNILAAEAGSVIFAGSMSGYGNAVIINHGKNKDGKEVWTLYAHIRKGGIKVNKGDMVKRGQKIAEVGMTGQSTGYHLHFEVRINESPVDPKPYLR